MNLPPPKNNIVMGPYQPPPRATGPGSAPNAPIAPKNTDPTAPQPGYMPARTGNGGGGRPSGTETSAGRGDIPGPMQGGRPDTGGQPYTPISGSLPVSPLGSIPGEQMQPSGNSPADFSPRAAESQQSAGARVRDSVRMLVRRNGGSPADLG
jgi:hypothetical protein